MTEKQEFREILLEAVNEDHGSKTMEELEQGISDGWACRWPDCSYEEYGCGTRYGCAFARMKRDNP